MEVIVILASVAVFITSTCGVLGNGASLRTVMVTSDVKTTFSVLLILTLVSDISNLLLGMIQMIIQLVGPSDNPVVALLAFMDITSNMALLSAAGLAIDRCLALKMQSSFVWWNTLCGRTVVALLVILGACSMTPWTSHVFSVSRCDGRNSVTVSEMCSYLAAMVAVTATVGATFYFSKWIIKLEVRVADVSTQQRFSLPCQHKLRNDLRCCRAMRWVILEEVLTYACLYTIAIASMVNTKKCLSHICLLWWYRLLVVTSKAMKPFLLILLSRHFRKSVIHVCFRQISHRPNTMFYSSDDDTNDVNTTTDVQYRADDTSTFAVTSVDSNHLACTDRDERIANAVVATFQGRPYPFQRSAETVVNQKTSLNSPSSSSITIDVGSSTYGSASSLNPAFSIHDLLPGQYPIQSMVDDPEESLSVNVNCNFQLVIKKRLASSSSCPDLDDTEYDPENTLECEPQKRDRAQTVGAKSNEALNVGIKGLLHLARKDHAELSNRSNLTCGDVNESIENISTQCNASLSVMGDMQNNLSNKNSMRKQSSDTCSNPASTYVNNSPTLSFKAIVGNLQGMVETVETNSPVQNPSGHSIPDIFLINDENVSTQVPHTFPMESRVSNNIATDSMQTSISSIRPTPSDQNSNDKHNICNVETASWRGTETDSSQRRLSLNGRRYSFQTLQLQEKTTKQRHASESTKDMATTSVRRQTRPDSLSICHDPHDCPPELRLAFCTPIPSGLHACVNLESSSNPQEQEDVCLIQPYTFELTTASTSCSAYNSVLTPQTSPVECVDIVSTMSSPATSPIRKVSIYVYDPVSHVYLGKEAVGSQHKNQRLVNDL